jgi:guanylate kinase
MGRQGNLIIVSGPSGAGKSALAASLLTGLPDLRFSVSYTTRPARGNERDGIEYHFVTTEQFDRLRLDDELLEWAEVYGNFYGTSKRVVEEILKQGQDLLLDLDVQGARSIRRQRPEALSVFILPPSMKVLRERLERRRLDKDYVIEKRLRIACSEIQQFREYDYLIINDEFQNSADELKAIIVGSRCRLKARADSAESIVATFGGIDAEHSG